MARKRTKRHLEPGGPLTLDRWADEPMRKHRALLLLAMQDPGSCTSGRPGIEGRSIAAVSKAIGTQPSTLYNWVKPFYWRERIKASGSIAQAYAIELYRKLYMADHGAQDLAEAGLASVISLPVTTLNDPTAVQEEALQLVRKLTPPDPPPEVQQQVQTAIDMVRQRQTEQNKTLSATGWLAVEVIRQGLKAASDPEWAEKNQHVAPIRASVRDLPAIHSMLQDLEEERTRLENPEVVQASGPVAVESVRVRIAQETGGDEELAVLQDCQEIVAILTAKRQPALSMQDLENERQQAQGGTGAKA